MIKRTEIAMKFENGRKKIKFENEKIEAQLQESDVGNFDLPLNFGSSKRKK